MFFYTLTYSFAQLPAEQSKEKKYKWGFALAINSVEAQVGEPEWESWGYAAGNFKNFGDITNKSISLSITPKYFISNDILLRFEFGITKINMTSYHDANAHLVSNNPTSTIIINQNIEQNIYRYIPSVQWNFMRKKFIESFCGITASYLKYTDMNYHNLYESISLPNDSIMEGFDDKATATGGFAIGVGAFAGFNIYLQKHISLGAEFSSALLYKKIGGRFSGEVVDLVNPNSSVNQTYSFYWGAINEFQFYKILSSFNISVWL